MKCLKCNAERNLQDLQCPECGVVYAKYDAYLEKKAIEDKAELEKKLKRLEELERKEQERANTEANPTPENKKMGCLPMLGYAFLGFFILVLISAISGEKQTEQKTVSVEDVAAIIQKKREAEKKAYDAMTPEQRVQFDAEKAQKRLLAEQNAKIAAENAEKERKALAEKQAAEYAANQAKIAEEIEKKKEAGIRNGSKDLPYTLCT